MSDHPVAKPDVQALRLDRNQTRIELGVQFLEAWMQGYSNACGWTSENQLRTKLLTPPENTTADMHSDNIYNNAPRAQRRLTLQVSINNKGKAKGGVVACDINRVHKIRLADEAASSLSTSNESFVRTEFSREPKPRRQEVGRFIRLSSSAHYVPRAEPTPQH